MSRMPNLFPPRGRGGPNRSRRGRGQNDPSRGSGRGGRGEEVSLQHPPPPQQALYPPQEYSMGGQYGPPSASYYDGDQPSGYNPPPSRPLGPPPPVMSLPYDEERSSSSHPNPQRDKGKKRARDPSPPPPPPRSSSRSSRQGYYEHALNQQEEILQRLVDQGMDENLIRCMDLENEANLLITNDLLGQIDAMYTEIKHLREKVRILTERAFAPLPPSRRSSSRGDDDRTDESSRPPSSRSRLNPSTSNTTSTSRSMYSSRPTPPVTNRPPVPLYQSEASVPPAPSRSYPAPRAEEVPQPPEPFTSGGESHMDADTTMTDANDIGPPGWTYSDPVRVVVPGDLVPKPQILKDTRLESAPKTGKDSWSMYQSDDDDDQEDVSDERSDSELTAKQRKKKQNRLEQQRRDHERRRMKDQGRIPDIWGVFKTRTGVTERNNEMRFMLSWKVHHSPRTNVVTTGASAQNQSRRDINEEPPFESRNPLYTAAPRGLPLNPHEVDQLRGVVATHHVNEHTRAEAYALLEELWTIASRTMPQVRDRAMQHILDCGFRSDSTHDDIPTNSEAWTVLSRSIPRDYRGAITGNQNNATGGVGVPPPTTEEMLHIDVVGQWMLLHGRPGMTNFIHGTVINYQFAVHRRSAFGYGLMRLLAPQGRAERVAYNRRLAIIFASPHLYREAIARYNQEHPSTPFQEQTGPTFEFRRANFPTNSIGNLSIDDVICSLIFNRVPPAWVDHAYLYGLHSMANSYNGSAIHDDIYREYDNERRRRLREFGVPPAIPEWDGWRYPTRDDYHRILLLTRSEEQHGNQDWFADGRWLLVGESPYFTRLMDGPHRTRNILGMTPPTTRPQDAVRNPTASSSSSTLPSAVTTTPTAVNTMVSAPEVQAMDETPDLTVPCDSATESVVDDNSTNDNAGPTDSVDPLPFPGT